MSCGSLAKWVIVQERSRDSLYRAGKSMWMQLQALLGWNQESWDYSDSSVDRRLAGRHIMCYSSSEHLLLNMLMKSAGATGHPLRHCSSITSDRDCCLDVAGTQCQRVLLSQGISAQVVTLTTRRKTINAGVFPSM